MIKKLGKEDLIYIEVIRVTENKMEQYFSKWGKANLV